MDEHLRRTYRPVHLLPHLKDVTSFMDGMLNKNAKEKNVNQNFLEILFLLFQPLITDIPLIGGVQVSISSIFKTALKSNTIFCMKIVGLFLKRCSFFVLWLKLLKRTSGLLFVVAGN